MAARPIPGAAICRLSADGLLQTGEGLPVIGDDGPITVPPGGGIAIAPDGTVLVAQSRRARCAAGASGADQAGQPGAAARS